MFYLLVVFLSFSLIFLRFYNFLYLFDYYCISIYVFYFLYYFLYFFTSFVTIVVISASHFCIIFIYRLFTYRSNKIYIMYGLSFLNIRDFYSYCLVCFFVFLGFYFSVSIPFFHCYFCNCCILYVDTIHIYLIFSSPFIYTFCDPFPTNNKEYHVQLMCCML